MFVFCSLKLHIMAFLCFNWRKQD